MKASANQLRQAIDKETFQYRLVLLHGPDEAGARDWAMRLGRRLGDGVERVDIEGPALRSDPGRLTDEAASMSLFGERRYILVTHAGEECAEAAALLLALPEVANSVVMIAPNVKASGKLVKLAVAAPQALAHGCYQPVGAEANSLASAIAAEHGLRANGTVAARLVAASAGDRAILTREIEKLALYLDAAPDRPKTLDDAALDAVGADLGESEISAAIDAAVEGQPAMLADELGRLASAGTSPIPVLRALVRRLITLSELAGDVASGASVTEAIDRRNIFFREKAGMARALRLWPASRLPDAIEHIRRAERGLMASASAGDVLAAQAMMDIARAAMRRR